MSGLRKAVAGVVGACALALGVAAPAGATITSVSPNPIGSSGGTITVSGTVPAGANAYSLAICNVDAPPVGSACDRGTGSFTSITPATGAYSRSLVASPSFFDYSYIPPMGFTGGFTTCKGLSTDSQCAVVASYYVVTGGIPTPFGAPSVFNITF
jgi:hypothetical protein